MAVIPADRQIDLNKLSIWCKKELVMVDETEATELYQVNHIHMLPPFALNDKTHIVVDKVVANYKQVIFPIGVDNRWIKMDKDVFLKLSGCRKVIEMSQQKVVEQEVHQFSVRKNIEARLRDTLNMPKLSQKTQEILAIKNNPYATAGELISVVNADPLLAHQMIKYASIHYTSSEGEVFILEDAVNLVLGYDLAIEVALGFSILRSMKNDCRSGPIAKDAFWKDAIYTAQLAHMISNQIHYSIRPSPEISFLTGLLHNLGIAIFAHMFPSFHARLNRTLTDNSSKPFVVIENEVLGYSHTELAKHVMRHWKMSEDLVEAGFAHHSAAYRSDFSEYSNIIFIANALLKRIGVGDALSTVIPQSLLDKFGLSEEQLNLILSTFTEREALMHETIVEVAA
jgi:HD-like signal output (HDOD) protein